MRRGAPIAGGLLLLALGPAGAGAQFGASAEVERPMASERAAGDPAAAAERLERDGSPRAGEQLGDRLAEVPGAALVRRGAAGAFEGLSLRGSDLDQVELLVEEVPVGPASGGGADLSAWPLQAFEAVEVFRGPVPLSLGGGGIGGAVRLRVAPPREEAAGGWLEGRAAAGSFGTASGAVRARLAPGRWRLLLGAGAWRTDGDYPYLDDGGTRFDPSDDVERVRRGGRLARGWAVGHLGGPLLGGRLGALLLLTERVGGLQGAPVEEPLFVRRAERRLLAGASWRWGEPLEADGGARGPSLRLSLAALRAERRVSDLLGEMFPGGSVRRDRTGREQLRLDGVVPLGGGFSAGLLASAARERFEPSERLRPVALPSSSRWRLPLGLALRWRGRLAGRRTALRLQGRIEPWRAALRQVRPERLGEAEEGAGLAPTVRLAAALEPVGGLSLVAVVGRSVRLPSLFELFGDGAWVLGDASLRPETAWSAEAGLVVAGRAGPLSGRAELRAFGAWSRDLVRYVRNSRFQVVPRNVDRARVAGLELGGRARLGPLGLLLSAGWLRAEDLGLRRRLPLRPALRLLTRLGARVEAGPLRLLPYADAEHVGERFADPANTVRLPARTVLGLGVEASEENPAGRPPRWRLRLSVRDVLDARPLDVVGYPLPGRRWAVELVLGEAAR